MIAIKNENVKIAAKEPGYLCVTDLKRGAEWILEDCSLLFGGEILKNEEVWQKGADAMEPLRFYEASKIGQELRMAYSADGRLVEYRYRLLPDGFEVKLIAESAGDLRALSMPGSFAPLYGCKKYLLPVMQGMLWTGKGPYTDRILRNGQHVGFSMQMYGVLSEYGGLLCAAEESVDSRWRYVKDKQGYRVYNIAVSSLGKMAYDRTIRFYFTDNTVTAAAKRYRRFVMDAGRFVSWEEKIAARPAVGRLFGALMCYIGYLQDDIDYAAELKKLKKMGFERALVYPCAFNTYNTDFRMGGLPPIRLSHEQIAEIKAMGYDVSPWSWLNEAIVGRGHDDMFIENADKERLFGWKIDDFEWYKVCPSVIERRAAAAEAGEFSDMTWEHFDVLTCATVGECYAKSHGHEKPLSRKDELAAVRRTLKHAADCGEGGRFVSSEGFNDLFSKEYDLGSVKAWPQYGPWGFWPVPLTSLVYHDSMIHSWWEVHNYNAPYFNGAPETDMFEYGGGMPDLQSALDALTGSPPDVFPFGAQYAWTGRGRETYVYRFRFEDRCVQYALKKALPVARLHKETGMLEMTDFTFLSADGWLQRTVFGGKIEVTANFSNRLIPDVPDIGEMPPRSWRARRISEGGKGESIDF